MRHNAYEPTRWRELVDLPAGIEQGWHARRGGARLEVKVALRGQLVYATVRGQTDAGNSYVDGAQRVVGHPAGMPTVDAAVIDLKRWCERRADGGGTIGAARSTEAARG